MRNEVMVIEPDKLDRQISPFVQAAQELTVIDSATYEEGGIKVIALKDLRKQIDAEFDPTIESAHKAHKNAVALKRKFTDRLDEAEKIIKGKLLLWKSGQDRLLRIEQAKQEEEHRKLMVLVEKESNKAIKKGNLADAVAIKESVPEFIRQESTVPKTGFTIITKWKARVVNIDLLPKTFMIPDMDKLNNIAMTYKEKGYPIPGVEYYKEETSRMGRI